MIENAATGSSAYFDCCGRALEVASLQPVGCYASVHVPFTHRAGGKLAPRFEDGVFLGYASSADRYLVYVMGTTCTTRWTEDVAFNDVFFPWAARLGAPAVGVRSGSASGGQGARPQRLPSQSPPLLGRCLMARGGMVLLGLVLERPALRRRLSLDSPPVEAADAIKIFCRL